MDALTARRKTTVMECTVHREWFLRRLKPVAEFIPRKTVSKMAGTILIEVRDRAADEACAITVSSYRARESASWTIKPEDDSLKAGKACVNGRLLLDFVNNGIKSKHIEMRSDGEVLTLSGSDLGVKGSFKLECFDPDEFPANFNTDVPVATFGTVKADQLKLMINRVAWCADNVQDRPYCAGVLFDFFDGKLTVAATDTNKLSAGEVGPLILPEGVERPADLQRMTILPKESVSDLLSLLPEGTEDVSISAAQGWLAFEHAAANSSMRARFGLIDHRFPNYRMLFTDRDLTRCVSFNGAQLGRLMRIMAPFVAGGLDLEIIGKPDADPSKPSPGVCRAASTMADVGEARDEVPVTLPAGMTSGRMRIIPKQVEMVSNLVGNEVFGVFVPGPDNQTIRVEAAERWLVGLATVSEGS